MRRIIAAVLASVVLVLTAGSPSVAGGAPFRTERVNANGRGIGIRLVDIPTDLADDPRARTYIIDNLSPGTTIQRRVEVTNSTDSPLHVELYAGAADIKDGSFIGAPDRTANELTSWTTLRQETVDVPAGGSARGTAAIAVPKDAAPGERYAVIWAQVKGKSSGSITLVSRTGVRIYLSVGGNNPPPPMLTADSMTAARDGEGRGTVVAQVHNVGGRALDLTGTLKLSHVDRRLTAGPYNIQLGVSLAPGQSGSVKALVTDLVDDGPWTATLELKSGLLQEAYQATITFPRAGGGAVPVAAHPSETPTRVSPLLLLGLLAAVVLLLVTAGRLRHARRAARAQARDEDVGAR
ncbi:peptidase [Kitasatospora sp. NPDC007106]|uniref:peptidase n=1 Tax=Kitasatospora sp. NPDC007106 TaxID=3156914 RepID=UPI0033C0F8C4